MLGGDIGIGVHGDRAHAEPSQGADHAAGDLRAVRDEDAPKHLGRPRRFGLLDLVDLNEPCGQPPDGLGGESTVAAQRP